MSKIYSNCSRWWRRFIISQHKKYLLWSQPPLAVRTVQKWPPKKEETFPVSTVCVETAALGVFIWLSQPLCPCLWPIFWRTFQTPLSTCPTRCPRGLSHKSWYTWLPRLPAQLFSYSLSPPAADTPASHYVTSASACISSSRSFCRFVMLYTCVPAVCTSSCFPVS